MGRLVDGFDFGVGSYFEVEVEVVEQVVGGVAGGRFVVGARQRGCLWGRCALCSRCSIRVEGMVQVLGFARERR